MDDMQVQPTMRKLDAPTDAELLSHAACRVRRIRS